MRRLAVLLLLFGAAACDSHADDVCLDIGDCSQGGSNDWIASCQAEAKALGKEASDAGCGAAFDDYFSCADSSYTCRGATASFPGCDRQLAALDSCLAADTTGTSCATLTARQASCAPGAGPDGGAGPGTGLPPACTARRDCVAACYLAQVGDLCMPAVDELAAVADCAASCPL